MWRLFSFHKVSVIRLNCTAHSHNQHGWLWLSLHCQARARWWRGEAELKKSKKKFHWISIPFRIRMSCRLCGVIFYFTTSLFFFVEKIDMDVDAWGVPELRINGTARKKYKLFTDLYSFYLLVSAKLFS